MAGASEVLEGYIAGTVESGDDSGEEDEDATATVEFLDPQETCCSAPPRRKVLFNTFRGQEYKLMGMFALTDPWWHITCNAQNSKMGWTVKGSPWYKIRTDLSQKEWVSIVSLFMVACNVPPYSILRFVQWLPKQRFVDVRNLMQVLCDFREGDDSGLAQGIIAAVSASAEGRRVRASVCYPSVMRHLPVLLPRWFLHLLDRPERKPQPGHVGGAGGAGGAGAAGGAGGAGAAGADVDNSDHILAKLEDIIEKDVWKLGFAEVMLKELNLVRCEAQLGAFRVCGLLKTVPLLQHNALLVYDQLKSFCNRTGSTYREKDDICEALRKDGIPDQQVREALPFLQGLRVVVCDKSKVALRNLHGYEEGIANCLRHLVNAPPWTIPINAKEVLRRSYAAAVDPFQLQAAEMMCANPVTVISGKGGCGKTTVVSQVFQAAVEQGCSVGEEAAEALGDDAEDPGEYPRGLYGVEERETREHKLLRKHVLLTAPTGRAASLLTKKTGFEAYTLHQVIWRYPYVAKGKNESEEWEFASVRVLVVDEGSLVSVQLLHRVLSMLIEHAKLQKLVILGDIRQLPSIQPGNTLHDLFSSLKVVYCAVEMMNNHRSESQLIIRNAQLIADLGGRRRTALNFDHVVNFPGPLAVPHDKSFIHVRLPDAKRDDDLQVAVKWLINSAPGLDDDSTSQFIAFRRADVALINELCCTHYCHHTTKDHKRKLWFEPKDKVCVTKSAFIGLEGEAPEKPDGEETQPQRRDGHTNVKKKERMRLCNGEIFFIAEDKTVKEARGQCQRLLTLDDREGCTVQVDYRELLRECKLRHAWARTIHTFQGSESETVVYVVGDCSWQTWRHVYTAITRGQKRVYMVATDKELEVAVGSKENRRLTRLTGLVKAEVVQLVMSSPEHPLHRQSPAVTPGRSGPRTPAPPTPGRSQAAPGGAMALVAKRLWAADGAEEDSNLGCCLAAAEKESPAKKTKSV